MIKKDFRVTFKLVGKDAPDLGMGAGVVGYQEFSLFAKNEKETKSSLFRRAVIEKAEELQDNFFRGEIEELN